jgi:hypothetical protein
MRLMIRAEILLVQRPDSTSSIANSSATRIGGS